jgi:hypothetical protein
VSLQNSDQFNKESVKVKEIYHKDSLIGNYKIGDSIYYTDKYYGDLFDTILSKRFEKEITKTTFGEISIVTAGPYYEEHKNDIFFDTTYIWRIK